MFSILLSFLLCVCVGAAPLQSRAYSNGPVVADNFPDPAFVRVEDGFYAFATTNGRYNVPTAHSLDFVDWKIQESDALPTLPGWATAPLWAPDVIELSDGTFVLYFTAAVKTNTNRHCIGTATSNAASGPYTPSSSSLVCPLDEGGAIDPAGFTDSDGTIYVVYKIDANSLGGGGACGNGDLQRDTPIMLQQLDKDGVTPVGKPAKILSRDDGDGPLIEAPSLVKSGDGTYVLFFSSNCYNGPYYDVSYATASAVGGPYTKSPKPLLLTGDDGGRLNSPGGADVGKDGRSIVFHSDLEPADAGVRQMWTAGIDIRDGIVSISAPSITSTFETS